MQSVAFGSRFRTPLRAFRPSNQRGLACSCCGEPLAVWWAGCTFLLLPGSGICDHASLLRGARVVVDSCAVPPAFSRTPRRSRGSDHPSLLCGARVRGVTLVNLWLAVRSKGSNLLFPAARGFRRDRSYLCQGPGSGVLGVARRPTYFLLPLA